MGMHHVLIPGLQTALIPIQIPGMTNGIGGSQRLQVKQRTLLYRAPQLQGVTKGIGKASAQAPICTDISLKEKFPKIGL